MSTKLETARRIAFCLALALVVAGCASGPAQLPTEVAQRIERAQFRADHESLATHFAQEAAKAKGIAADHRKMAAAYRARMDRGAGSMVAHCNSIVQSFEGVAADYEQMAVAHRQMAEQARP